MRIEDQEEINTKYLVCWGLWSPCLSYVVLTLILALLISNFNLLPLEHSLPSSQLSLLSSIQCRFPLTLGIKITSPIFTRASTFFHLCNMRPVEAWIFVTTKEGLLSYTGILKSHLNYRHNIHLPSSQCFLKGSTPWGVSFLFFPLAILILHSLFKGYIPWCFNSHF